MVGRPASICLPIPSPPVATVVPFDAVDPHPGGHGSIFGIRMECAKLGDTDPVAETNNPGHGDEGLSATRSKIVNPEVDGGNTVVGPCLRPHGEPAGGVEGRRNGATVERRDLGVAHVFRAKRQFNPNQSFLDIKATQTEKLVEWEELFEGVGELVGTE